MRIDRLTPRDIGSGIKVGLEGTQWKEIELKDYKANTEIKVSHSLNRVPKGFIVANNEPLGKGDTAWTPREIFVKYPSDVSYKKIMILIY